MPRFTIGYWPIRGLGSSPRMMLWACGEKDFENVEYSMSESGPKWSDDKFSLGLDFPNLPYLMDSKTGVKLTQTMALLRYLAETLKPEYATASAEMKPYVEMISQQMVDLRNAMVRCFYRSEGQAEVAQFCKESLPRMLEPFEKWLSKERDGPFLFGSLHYADFYFAEHVEQLCLLFEGCLGKYPKLEAYLQAFVELEEMKTFRETSYYRVSPINAPMALVNN